MNHIIERNKKLDEALLRWDQALEENERAILDLRVKMNKEDHGLDLPSLPGD